MKISIIKMVKHSNQMDMTLIHNIDKIIINNSTIIVKIINKLYIYFV
jgi:hypothetical protein